MSKPEELRQLADKFSEGWHEGIKIDAMDVMLLSDAASELETMQATLTKTQQAWEGVRLQRDELLAALQAVVAISDRKHDAWDAAKAAIDKALGLEA